MTDRLAHRGPDGEGHHLSGNAAIGHRRLSIIDVSTGAQPMSNEDNTIWVTFNGEIYNFADLRLELQRLGHVFRTHSDTEAIVHGYEQWGDDVVTRLRGIFAFGLLDERRRRLLLARDHFGVKPLVYFLDERRLAFASELKAITADPSIPRTIDPTAVADYFDYGYVPAPLSIYRGFHKLQPAHCLSVDLDSPSQPEQRRYWTLPTNVATQRDEREVLRQLEELLSESVRLQLMSDVPLGALLSGGVDSSAIVTMMAQQSSQQIKTFSIGFAEERFSETKYARQVAELVNSEHHEHIANADVATLLPRLVYHFDEPFADASAVPTYYLCEMARRNVTVCLAGDGGDEVFAGYQRHRIGRDQGRLDALPRWLRRAIFGPLSAVYPQRLPYASLVAGAASTPAERFLDHMRNQYGRISSAEWFTYRMEQQLPAGRGDLEFLRKAFASASSDPVQSYLDVDLQTYMPNDILTKTDITSMMNSLEVRVPLLDHKLVEFAATLPSTDKLRGDTSKYVLKEVLKKRLPPAILNRPKMGFGVPMRQWIAGALRPLTHAYLLDPSRTSGLLEPSLLRRMVEENEAELYNSRIAGKLWWALFFESVPGRTQSIRRLRLDSRGEHVTFTTPSSGTTADGSGFRCSTWHGTDKMRSTMPCTPSAISHGCLSRTAARSS